MKSEREQLGLRGPVKICTEETTYPATAAPDGSLLPERKTLHTTEYDTEGRIVSTRWNNPNGSAWITGNTYNASGQLLRTSRGIEGQTPVESIYAYDEQGRPQSITDSQNPDNPIVFHYDERGRKTKVLTSRPEDYRPNVSIAADSLFYAADVHPNIEGGGTATVIYDDQDRPTEIQTRDSSGELISRTLRTYDAAGRIVEEKLVHDDIVTMLPASARTEILQTPGASLDDLRDQLTKLMGGQSGPASTKFTYDAHGRVIHKTRRVFNLVSEIDITYNQQGDPVVEITRTTHADGSPDEYSEEHHTYQYDDHVNWTEKLDSYCSIPGGTPVPSDTIRRTLTYF